MLLGKPFQAFIDKSPACVMLRGAIERILNPDALERVFQRHAVTQYTRNITFAHCVGIMDAVVFKTHPSVGAWFQTHGSELLASRQSLYEKLQHVELNVSAGLVRYAGDELSACIRTMKRVPKAPLPGHRLRVLDGNHLSGTEHRLDGLRHLRAGALPGQALVFYDVRYDLITDVVPCEDAYSQERSLLGEALEKIARGACIVADRNFCTVGFLFGLANRSAAFVIREHAALPWESKGSARPAGKDGEGRHLKEQSIELTDTVTGTTLTVRRITIPLRKPNAKGETELHVLTNLPAAKAPARVVAEMYEQRWTVETAFFHLTQDLRCEIDTLAYPKAALFGFCTACVAYNAVSLVKASLRAAHGADFVANKLSMYYLTLEVARVMPGMEIAIPDWTAFGRMSVQEFVDTMLDVAGRMNLKKYTKHPRGPKTKQPKKTTCEVHKHVSTPRVLAGRK